MKKAIILIVLALLLSTVLGCAPKTVVPSEQDTEITADIIGIDELDAELDISELEDLDKDFAELESLFS